MFVDEHSTDYNIFTDTIDMVALHVPVHLPSASSTSPHNKDSSAITAPAPIKCLVYIGLPENPQFVGPQDPQKLAEHIVRSRGPSGENTEYVYMLEEALEQLRKDTGTEGEIDEHVVDLARRVREAERKLKGGQSDNVVGRKGEQGDGAEEVEK